MAFHAVRGWHVPRKAPHEGETMKNQRGQGLIEYLILVCLVAVSAIAILSVVGTNVKEQYARISNSLAGDKAKVSVTKPSKTTYQQRGLNDYTESSTAP